MPTGWTAAAAAETLEDRAAQYPYVKAHVGDPGAAGTLSAAAETTRVLAVWGTAAASVDGRSVELQWTDPLEWTGVAASEDWTYVSGWTDAVGGTCGWTGELNAPPQVSGSDFTIGPGDYTLRQPVAYNP